MDILKYIEGEEHRIFLVQISDEGTHITRFLDNPGLSLLSDYKVPSSDQVDAMVQSGVPLIDWRTVHSEHKSLVYEIPAPYSDARNLPFSASGSAPREVVASIAKNIGATISNIELINLHPLMFCKMKPSELKAFCGPTSHLVDEGGFDKKGGLSLSSAELQAILDICNTQISDNDLDREHLDKEIQEHLNQQDYSDSYYKASDDLKAHEFLDGLLSHYWAYIAYHGLQCGLGSTSTKDGLLRIKQDISSHREEYKLKVESLDCEANRPQLIALAKLDEYAKTLLSEIDKQIE